MSHELIEAATLCEEHGFHGPVVALRAASQLEVKVFAVLERLPVARHWYDGPKRFLSSDGVPLALFLREEAAKAYARAKNAETLRRLNPLNYLYEFESFTRYCTPLSVSDFEARVGEILGTPFRLSIRRQRDLRNVHDLPPMFPGDASDDQMLRITDLFSYLFCYVEEVEFGGRSEPGRGG